MLAIGGWAARRGARTESSFVLGDRSFGLLASWAALSSTTIGGSTTLVLSALIARKGLPGLWLDLAGALGLLALALFLARSIRETSATTLAEVIGRAYGADVRRIAAALVVLAEIVWFALLTQATETVVTSMTSFDPTAVLVLTAALFVAYTALGGQRAVIGTDLFQLALMIGSLLLVAFPLAVRSLVTTGLPAASLHFPTGPGFGLLDIAGLLVLVGLPHLVGSDVWGKLLSARDARTARSAAVGAVLSKLVFGVATATIALAGIALGLGAGPELFPRTIRMLVGEGLAPFLLVGLIATMQSSSDSVLLSAAAATTHDLLPPDRGHHRLAPLFVVLYGGLGLLLALALRDLVETFRLGYTLFASGLILPTLLAFVPGVRVSRTASGAAMIAGGVAALVATVADRLGHGLGQAVLVGTGVNAIVLLAGLRRARGAPSMLRS